MPLVIKLSWTVGISTNLLVISELELLLHDRAARIQGLKVPSFSLARIVMLEKQLLLEGSDRVYLISIC